MSAPPPLHDLACVVHLHSTYSDGTGAVPEIAAAARRNALDVVLLTDHDTLEARRRGEERWHGDVLVLVGCEVSPPRRNHYLAFGIEEEIDHRGLTPAQVCEAVRDAGGFGFAAHPFSEGSKRFQRAGPMPFDALDCAALTGLELWSFVSDTLEPAQSLREIARFVTRPGEVLEGPPQRNLNAWDRLCAVRPVVALGGLDAHQIGVRVAGRVPLRLMGYARSFRYLRTHLLVEELPDGDLAHDRAQVYAALRAGRCYIANGALAPPRGFAFWADGLPMGAEEAAAGQVIRARVPRPAELRLLRDGEEVTRVHGAEVKARSDGPGVWRVEARLGGRTWILSNPVYLR